ncbi:hypothetical protein [Streptomyces cinnamoneus]|uniref:hypothetical protein n=1 Tax=Streptomyces cinnamoneus TaxID=53446 RepID=UPI00167E1104|nr:hypothetical protein [Streptomyces cinnamoneus]
MTIWGRTAVVQPAVRAVLAVLASVLLVLSGAVAEGMESVSVREEIPASAPLADGSSDECTACTAEQRVPRPGRVGRPTGRRACPSALAPAAGAAGGLSGRQAPSRPGGVLAADDRAHHSVLRC